jgi:hypothetical protein
VRGYQGADNPLRPLDGRRSTTVQNVLSPRHDVATGQADALSYRSAGDADADHVGSLLLLGPGICPEFLSRNNRCRHVPPSWDGHLGRYRTFARRGPE